MKESFNYIAKLASVAIISFLKISLLAVFSTVVVAIIEFFLLAKSIDTGQSAHVSPIPFLVMVFSSRPIGSLLWYFTWICSPIVFFVLGNKYMLSKLAHKLIADKSESLIHPLLEKLVNKSQERQPELLKNTGDFSIKKLRIIQEIKNDESENKWLRKVIVFGMKKTNLEDVDFNQENQNFFDLIQAKTLQSLKNISKPSRRLIWITIAIQWAILIFIALTKY